MHTSQAVNPATCIRECSSPMPQYYCLVPVGDSPSYIAL